MDIYLEKLLARETCQAQDLAARIKACQRVDDCVRRGLFQYSGLRVLPHGGFACGLACPSGSLELTIDGRLTLSSLCSRESHRSNSRLESGLEGNSVAELRREHHVEILRIAEHQLWADGIIRERQMVTLAPTPVLIFRDSATGTCCELTVGNGDAAFKAQVLRQLTLVDPRVSQLTLLVKAWARRQGILDGSRGCLTFPCIILMVIFHLQTRPVPILPPICQLFGLAPNVPSRQRPQSGGKTPSGDLLRVSLGAIEKWGQRFRRNEESLATLLTSFWKFYEGVLGKWAAGHDPANRISAWTGKWRYAKWPTTDHVASVEDPFDATANCAQCITPQGLSLIQRRFHEANAVVPRLQKCPVGLQNTYEIEALFG